MPDIRDLLSYSIPVIQALFLSVKYQQLPVKIASHFDAAGTPHSYVPRAFLWIFVLITAADVALLRFVRSKPQSFNLPGPRNSLARGEQEVAVGNALTWISLETALMFSFVLWTVVRQGLHPGAPLKMLYLPLAVACVVLLASVHLLGVLKLSNIHCENAS